MEYYVNDPLWRESWKSFWDKKLSKKGFALSLSKKLGLPRGSVQSALANFKKGESLARIRYFLEKPKHLEAFLDTLEISFHDLEEWKRKIYENAQAPAAESQLYPYFDIELKDIEDGWIEPVFQKLNSHTPKHLSEILYELKEDKKINLIQSTIGKTRFLEHLRSSYRDDEVEYVYISELSALDNVNTEQKTVWMLDSDQAELRTPVVNKLKKESNNFSRKISLLIMIDQKENLEQVCDELGLKSETKSWSFRLIDTWLQLKKEVNFWQMEVVINKKTAQSVLENLKKHLVKSKERNKLDQIKKLIEKYTARREEEMLPAWCNRLGVYCYIIRILLDSDEESNISNYSWKSLFSDLLCLKISQLLPQSLLEKKERIKPVLSLFAALWIKKSLEINHENSRRYSNSILVYPTKKIFEELWKEILESHEYSLTSPTVRDLWKQLDSSECSIEKLRESLFLWKYMPIEKLTQAILDFPIWHQENYPSGEECNKVLRVWFSHTLKTAHFQSLKELFPALIYHNYDAILDSHLALQYFIQSSPKLITKFPFHKDILPLPPLEKHTYTLTIAGVSDVVEKQDLLEAWEYIFRWWDKVKQPIIRPDYFDNSAKESFPGGLRSSSFRMNLPFVISPTVSKKNEKLNFSKDFVHPRTIAEVFAHKYTSKVRLVSQKYKDQLPYIETSEPLCEDIQQRENADWFQRTEFMLKKEIVPTVLEWEPTEWLAENGNQLALDLLSGEHDQSFLLNQYKEKRKKYIGKGQSGWKASSLPSMLTPDYLEEPELEDWYLKLPKLSREIFFEEFLNSRAEKKSVLEKVFKIIQKHSPTFLEAKYLNKVDSYNGKKGIDNITWEFYQVSLVNIRFQENLNQVYCFLEVLSQYIDHKVYYQVLSKILLDPPERVYYKSSLHPWKYERYEPVHLEIGYYLLPYYAKMIGKEKGKETEKYLCLIEGYVQILLSFLEQCFDTKKERGKKYVKENFIRWFDRRWQISLQHETQLENKEATNRFIRRVLIFWGIKVLTKETIAFSFSQRFRIVQKLVEGIKAPRYVDTWDELRNFLNLSSVSAKQRQNFYRWLIKDLESNEKVYFFGFSRSNGFFFKELALLLKKDFPKEYEKHKCSLLETKPVNDSCDLFTRLFLLARDKEVFFWYLNIIQGSYLRLIPSIFQENEVEENWIQWLFECVDEHSNTTWDFFIDQMSYADEMTKEIFFEELNKFFLSLSKKKQVDCLEEILKKGTLIGVTRFLSPWLTSFLGKDFQQYHRKLHPILRENIDSQFLYNFPRYEDQLRECVSEIEKVLIERNSWLDWAPDNSFATLWLYLLHYTRECINKDAYLEYISWGERQMEKMKESSLAILENISFWNVLVYIFPSEKLQVHQENFYFMMKSFPEIFDSYEDKSHEELDLTNPYDLMNPLEITIARLIEGGKKEIVEEKVDYLVQNQDNDFLSLVLFDVFLPHLSKKDSDIYLKFFEKTLPSPFPITQWIMQSRIGVDFLRPMFSEDRVMQESLEFFLMKYISSQELAFIVDKFWMMETRVYEMIIWDGWYKKEKPPLYSLPLEFLEACRNLGASSMLNIAHYRCKEFPHEKPLWRVFLGGIFPHEERDSVLSSFYKI